MASHSDTSKSGGPNHGSPSESDWARLQRLIEVQMRWTHLDVSLQEISEENPKLVADLARFDRQAAVSHIAGLLTVPELQSNCIRIEILLALAVIHCTGARQASTKDLRRWFRAMGESRCASAEDQAEDVFVSLITDYHGDYRLLEGVWESAGFYTQRVVDVVLSMPDRDAFAQLKRSILALLTLSDTVCERAGLQRYQLGNPVPRKDIPPKILPDSGELASRVCFEFSMLDDLGITPDDLAPFLHDSRAFSALLQEHVGESRLDAQPLIILDCNAVVLAQPTAVSVALRNYVMAFVAHHGLVDEFDAQLARSYSAVIGEAHVLGKIQRVPVTWRKVGIHRIASVGTEVDVGHFLSFHFLLPSMRIHEPGGFKHIYVEEETLGAALQSEIARSVTHLGSQPGFQRGVVVCVTCGWGKGYCSPTEHEKRDGWGFESLSGADLVRLSALDDMSPLYFWRLQEALAVAESAGLHIENINGLMNAVGWIRANHGHVVPHEDLPPGRISPERPFRLMPPLNLLRDVRAAADGGVDRHRRVDPVGRSHELQRVSPQPLFSPEGARRIYGSLSDVHHGEMTSVYLGQHALWLSVCGANLSTSTLSRLWEMGNEWLHRVGRALDALIPDGGPLPALQLEFLDDDGDLSVCDSEVDKSELAKLWRLKTPSAGSVRRLTFDRGFLGGFQVAENVAEAQVVRALLQGYLHGRADVEPLVEAAFSQIVLNSEARHFHLMQAQCFSDFVRESLPKELVIVEALDDATARLGLGWSVLPDDHDGVIDGKVACVAFLNSLVKRLSQDIVARLHGYERNTVVERLIANHEKAAGKEAHFVRTSAALMGLHGRGPEVMQAIVEQMSNLAGASVTSRVLAEIAICACPLEGQTQISQLELRRLMARTTLLIHLGGVANAMRFDALPASIRVSPLGEVLFADDFGRFVVAPTLSQMTVDRYVASAPHQHRNYRPPEFGGRVGERVDSDFHKAWVAETGFDLDQMDQIISAMEDHGIALGKAIFRLHQSEFVQRVQQAGLTADIAERFLDQFALPTRAQWDVPPSGFVAKDLFPWRFGRRLSFVSRPILILDTNADPWLLVAPHSLRRGIAQVTSGAYYGQLEQAFFRSPQMRNAWLGKASRGHAFNDEVSSTLRAAGWTVRSNIGLPEILQRKLPRDFGDVDALAWRSDRNEVLVIECKDLSPARNYSEMAALLSEYQGIDHEGKPDKLKRHLDRVALLVADTGALSRSTGLAQPRVVAWLVCSGVVPMQFAKVVAQKVAVGGVAEVLNRHR